MAGFLGIGGGGPSINTNQAQGYLSALGGLATSMGSGYNAATQQYAGDNSNFHNALNAYSKYLTTNPATQQYNAMQVANAEQGASEGADRALANTEAGLASRGIQMNSGLGAGTLADINAQLAANNATVQNNVAQNNINRYGQNLGTNAELLGGAANTAFGQAADLGGQALNANQTGFGDSNQLAQENYQSQLQQEQAPLGFMGALGSFLGNLTPTNIFGNLPKQAVAAGTH